MIKRCIAKLRQLWSIARFCARIAPAPGVRYLRAFYVAVGLCRKRRFLPAEAFRLGLFDPDLPPDEAGRYVSRKELTKIQKALNPQTWAVLAKDKSLFYRHCMAMGVATPRLFAILHANGAGWAHDGRQLATRQDWWRFFALALPPEFVVKPAMGAYGKGFNIFRREGEAYRDAYGTLRGADELYEVLCGYSDKGGAVVQERLDNHGELIRLTGVEYLQTVRMISLLDERGSCRILHAHLKAIVGENIIDTHLFGQTGNVEAPVCIQSGRLRPAKRVTGSGIQTIDVHPNTRIPFGEFQLPFWEQACEMVRMASHAFNPLRTLGWDVALGPEGPRIVEANVWWDPPNQHGCMPRVLAALNGGS
ncbi:MAG: hypothetical protein HQ546_11035 [Planctomycetes bacterium]|nr:hypothetical protein [Planctomycetota bacterium]